MYEQDQEDHLVEEPEVLDAPEEAEVGAVVADVDVPADTEAAADVEVSDDTEVSADAEVLTAAEVLTDIEVSTEVLEDEQVQEETSPVDSYEDDDGRSWYVVHCYSGYENKVHHNLMQRIESMGMQDMIFDVVVPTEEEIEVKEGKRRTVERRVFPGYILVNMLLTEESWYVVRNTPGVTGFVGMGNTPIPLRPEEVAHIVKRMEADAPRIKVTFRIDERVRIIEGPFKDFHGTVSELDMERAKVRVMVNFFGRETPVELDFLQVEKM